MITITKIDQTCWACPSQWDMWANDGKQYYVRYRWGHLTVDSVSGDRCEPLYGEQHGHNMHGIMETETMQKHLYDIFDFELEG